MASRAEPTTNDMPVILARGPWNLDQVTARWRTEHYEPPSVHVEAADAEIAELRERGSPSHDGLAGRLVDYREGPRGIELEMQPLRWALRLVAGDASCSMAALCVTRAADGRWLAGRRAAWLSSWAGRWALGAGGSVELSENPVDTLTRELQEEWSVEPERLSIEALVCLESRVVLLVGMAWLPDGAT